MNTLKSRIRVVPNFPKPGISFKDISSLIKDPVAFSAVIQKMQERWEGRVDAIAALDARGFIFGSPLALALQVPLAMVRKRGKLPGPVVQTSYGLEYGSDTIELQEDAFTPGARVLVVDDLLATGGTARAAATLIAESGATIAGFAFVIELTALNGRAQLSPSPIQSLVIYTE